MGLGWIGAAVLAGCACGLSPALAQSSLDPFAAVPLRSDAGPVLPAPATKPTGVTRRPVYTIPAASTQGTVRVPVNQPVAAMPTLMTPVPQVRRRRPVDDPYAPLGLRLGNVNVLPAIEQSIGYDTNPNRVSGTHKGSLVSRTDAELRLQSDWSRNNLDGFLRGGYSAYKDVDGADRPDGEGRITYRHDFTRSTQGTLETRFAISTERPGSPDATAGTTNRPIVATYGTEAGVSQTFNRLTLGLRGSIDRTTYDPAELSNGLTVSQSTRNYNQYALKLRASYELTPGLIPFVETSVDRRERDDTFDSAGYERSSNGASVRVGTTLEFTRKLTGQAAVGYQARSYDDNRLRELRGPIADAALIWSVTPLTSVRLDVATSIDETDVIGASGILGRRAGLEIRHDLRRNLTLVGTAGIGRADYRGAGIVEDSASVGARVEYKLSRSLVVKASFSHERLKSTSPGSDYTANVYLVGLRLQR